MDQSVRRNITGIDSRYKLITFNTYTDSLSIFDDRKLESMNLSKIGLIDDQLKKLKSESKKDYLTEIEDSYVLLNYVDSLNRVKYYRIIKKYGYPSYDLRNWKNDKLKVGITTLLTHSDPNNKFGQKLFKLIIKEYYKGRVEEGEMRHYLWHVQGREGEIDRETNISELVKKSIQNHKKTLLEFKH